MTDYEHANWKLRYCTRDVEKMRDAFIKRLDVPEENIVCISDETETKPAYVKIHDQISNLHQRFKIAPDDVLFFFFSGHGIRDPKHQTDLLLPLDSRPNTIDGTSIPIPRIVDFLKKTGCQNIVMFIDACRSKVQLAGAKGAENVESLEAGLGEASRQALEKEAQIVSFFSCDPHEKSYEIEPLEHGSFTYLTIFMFI